MASERGDATGGVSIEKLQAAIRSACIAEGIDFERYWASLAPFYERAVASEIAAPSADDLKAALNIGLAALGYFNTEQTDKHWNEQERVLREIETRAKAARSATREPTFDAVQLSEARYYRDSKEPIGILARAVLRANGEMK